MFMGRKFYWLKSTSAEKFISGKVHGLKNLQAEKSTGWKVHLQTEKFMGWKLYRLESSLVEKFMGKKFHMITSYLLLMTFRINGIQALQYQWKKGVDHQNDYIENSTAFCYMRL